MEKVILIATSNPGKTQEIRAILSSFKDKLKSTQDLSLTLTVEETGKTYAENARLKAVAYLKAAGVTSLADDSGLEVDALHGSPGIHSARYSPKANATDADRQAFLLQQLKGNPQPWTAHFYCCAILALPDGRMIETSGRCNGIIIPEARGTGGFGYDPIFFLPEYLATMAELPARIKNLVSHRAKALQAMIPFIQEYYLL